MASKTARPAEIFDLKSASLSLLALVLRSADLAGIEAELRRRLGETPDLFNHEPLLIDLTSLVRAPALASGEQGALALDGEAAQAPLDLGAVVTLLRNHRMQPVAVRGATETEAAQARALGLAEAPEDSLRMVREAAVREVVREVRVEVPVEVPVQVPVQVPAAAATTMIVERPLRSGQQVYAKGGDLVVLALVNPGAEVIADGSIHVYAPLRGKAIAGARGDETARIFAASMEPELVSIAGTYRTTENPLPADVLGRAAQIRLDGEKLVMEPLKF
ncbi:MAG: septum site-determining protein MinC [Paucibacter sp.]|nr:septum site-determining protein MinC [Roseateles sp.]